MMNKHFKKMLLLQIRAVVGVLLTGAAIMSCSAQESLKVTDSDMPRRAALSPSQALESFELEPGFSIELVAHEPQVTDPVAIAFDENGGLYALEMRGYSERMDALLGRVKYLQDLDEDGFFETSTIFAENLAWPTAIACAQGGVVVIGVPDMYFLKDQNGDLKADLIQKLYSGFGSEATRLNVQQLPNNLTWGPDHRFHGAGGGNASLLKPMLNSGDPIGLNRRDFTLNPLDWSLKPISGGAQHGLTLDSFGRTFVCSNSHHIQTVLFESDWFQGPSSIRVPNPLMDIAAEGPAATVYRSSPDEPWRVIRTQWRVDGKVPGPVEGGGTPSGYFTAATGIVVYRGDNFPESHHGATFIADAGSNLVHRKILELAEDEINWTARRALPDRKSEFLRSSDNWFRPVQLENGPDGALYVLDMYREVIEHPWSLPEPLKSKIDLNSGMDRGRIYRIRSTSQPKPKPFQPFAKNKPRQWVNRLQSDIGWTRDTASRLIYESQDTSILCNLEALIQSPAASPTTVVQSLGAWKGLGGARADIYQAAVSYPNADVREVALQWLPEWIAENDAKTSISADWIFKTLSDRIADNVPRVRWMAWNAYSQLRVAGQIQPDAAWMTSAISALANDLDSRWILIAAGRALALDSMLALESWTALNTDLSDSGAVELWSDWMNIAAQSEPVALAGFCLELVQARSPKTALDWLALERLAGMRNNAKLQSEPATIQAIQSSIQSSLEIAQAIVGSKESAAEERIRSIQYLRQFPIDPEANWLRQGLRADQPEASRELVADIIDSGQPAFGGIYLASWTELTPQLKQRAVNYWLSTSERLELALKGWKSQGLQWSALPRDFRAALVNIESPFVKSWVKSERPETATELSASASLEKWTSALKLTGNRDAGKKHFTERCVSCHRLRGEGYAVGPDLEAALAMGKLAFMNAILNPSQEIDSRYTLYELTLTNDQIAQGVIQQETGSALTLKFPYAIQQDFNRDTIQSLKGLPISLMPENLEEDWSNQDMADLLEFIFKAD